MPKSSASFPTEKSVNILSRLIFSPRQAASPADVLTTLGISEISREEFDDLVNLGNLNHVLVRGLETFLRVMQDANDEMRAAWAASALSAERARIEHALGFLQPVCETLREEGHAMVVIKSLDHWPDLGSDLDLYTDADSATVAQLMAARFQATVAAPSWGDRLACKWNFIVPGLPEAVEIHMGRLGQTGEQVTIASRLVARARSVSIGDRVFRVPSASDRLLISTLQRMYRHFYFRLCDMLDTTELAESGAIDFGDLRDAALAAGIWEGVATYLAIVSDYVLKYRGFGLDLPQFVKDAARFGGAAVYYARGFIRVPILPNSAKLYSSQLTGLLRKRQLHNTARLSLLPWLATAAFVGDKITGSDKGIW